MTADSTSHPSSRTAPHRASDLAYMDSLPWDAMSLPFSEWDFES